METIVCQHCGVIDNYSVERKANNDVATCKSCGKHIKNIPYSKPALYYGKYAGIAIENYTNDMLKYLRWVRNNPDHFNKLSSRIQDAINIRLNGHL